MIAAQLEILDAMGKNPDHIGVSNALKRKWNAVKQVNAAWREGNTNATKSHVNASNAAKRDLNAKARLIAVPINAGG